MKGHPPRVTALSVTSARISKRKGIVLLHGPRQTRLPVGNPAAMHAMPGKGSQITRVAFAHVNRRDDPAAERDRHPDGAAVEFRATAMASRRLTTPSKSGAPDADVIAATPGHKFCGGGGSPAHSRHTPIPNSSLTTASVRHPKPPRVDGGEHGDVLDMDGGGFR